MYICDIADSRKFLNSLCRKPQETSMHSVQDCWIFFFQPKVEVYATCMQAMYVLQRACTAALKVCCYKDARSLGMYEHIKHYMHYIPAAYFI